MQAFYFHSVFSFRSVLKNALFYNKLFFSQSISEKTYEYSAVV